MLKKEEEEEEQEVEKKFVRLRDEFLKGDATRPAQEVSDQDLRRHLPAQRAIECAVKVIFNGFHELAASEGQIWSFKSDPSWQKYIERKTEDALVLLKGTLQQGADLKVIKWSSTEVGRINNELMLYPSMRIENLRRRVRVVKGGRYASSPPREQQQRPHASNNNYAWFDFDRRDLRPWSSLEEFETEYLATLGLTQETWDSNDLNQANQPLRSIRKVNFFCRRPDHKRTLEAGRLGIAAPAEGEVVYSTVSDNDDQECQVRQSHFSILTRHFGFDETSWAEANGQVQAMTKELAPASYNLGQLDDDDDDYIVFPSDIGEHFVQPPADASSLYVNDGAERKKVKDREEGEDGEDGATEETITEILQQSWRDLSAKAKKRYHDLYESMQQTYRQGMNAAKVMTCLLTCLLTCQPSALPPASPPHQPSKLLALRTGCVRPESTTWTTPHTLECTTTTWSALTRHWTTTLTASPREKRRRRSWTWRRDFTRGSRRRRDQ